MVNYQHGKIYKIECHQTGLIYIGSTSEPTLARRLSNHIKNYRYWKKTGEKYTTSYKIFENENYDISLLESYPCNTRDELTAREKHYIKTTECVNKVIPSRNKREYYNDNKEQICEKSKKYNLENKESIIQYAKQYREENSETLKEKRIEYYQKHKEKRMEYNRQYQLLNKEKILEQKKQKRQMKILEEKA